MQPISEYWYEEYTRYSNAVRMLLSILRGGSGPGGSDASDGDRPLVPCFRGRAEPVIMENTCLSESEGNVNVHARGRSVSTLHVKGKRIDDHSMLCGDQPHRQPPLPPITYQQAALEILPKRRR